MMHAELVDRVRRRLASDGADLSSAAVAAAVRAEMGGVAAHEEVLSQVRHLRGEFLGVGPLEDLVRRPDVTDVLVTGPNDVWTDGADGLRRVDVSFPDEAAVRRLAQRLALSAGRRLDDAMPFVDGWLHGDGHAHRIRFHAVLPPIAAGGTCVSLRMLRPATHDLAELVRRHTVGPHVADVLRAIVRARLTFLISGATGAGKTTLMAALLNVVPHSERVVCIEDAGELEPMHPQFVRLIARTSNVEGAGAVTLRDLVREALRMRPDRIVVGEVRGAEVCELLNAFNTGHDGGAGTLHANASSEVPARLEALAALGDLDRAGLHSQLAAAVQIVLHMRRAHDGRRMLSEIGVLDRTDKVAVVRPVWTVEGWTKDRELLVSALAARRVAMPS